MSNGDGGNGASPKRRSFFAAIDIHLAQRLGERREQLGLSRTELDSLIGERPGTIARFERGARRLGADHVHFLSVALDVPVEWFYDGLEPTLFEGMVRLPNVLGEKEIDDVLEAYYAIDNASVRRDIVGLTRAVAASGPKRRS